MQRDRRNRYFINRNSATLQEDFKSRVTLFIYEKLLVKSGHCIELLRFIDLKPNWQNQGFIYIAYVCRYLLRIRIKTSYSYTYELRSFLRLSLKFYCYFTRLCRFKIFYVTLHIVALPAKILRGFSKQKFYYLASNIVQTCKKSWSFYITDAWMDKVKIFL